MHTPSTTVAALAAWLPARYADDFPYDAVVAEYRRVGKHLVATSLLEALDRVRAILPEVRGSAPGTHLLERFLDTALDKRDGRYANPTYLGLSLLPIPAVDDHDRDIAAVEREYDWLFVQLLADAARFEVAAGDGETSLSPLMRPDARTIAKRCRLVLQAAGPGALRLELDNGVAETDPIAGARRLWANVAADLSPEEGRTLQLTMLPVSLVHDEHQFIRVLQSFEATFALVAVHLGAAVRALSDGEVSLALRRIRAAETTLREAAPLFSLVATMQVEAFQTFRAFTEGASAIQSRHYKIAEATCRRPDLARLDSPAHLAVPEVRQRVLAGQTTLEEALVAAHAADRVDSREIDDLEQAMRCFAATLVRWRRTHHRIAVRMLGERTGTGYTEGAAYLAAVQAIPVFSTLPIDEDAEDGFPTAPAQERAVMAAHGCCPFAGLAVSAAPAV